MDAQGFSRIYLAKASAELSAADALIPGSERVACRGAAMADVLLVCGEPEAADLEAGRALSGPAGEAAAAALKALDVDPERTLAACARPVDAPSQVLARRLELIIESADPGIVIALDGAAAEDLARACSLEPLVPGRPVRWRGRTVGCVGDLAASLSDTSLKAGVWSAFRRLVSDAGPVTAKKGVRSEPPDGA